MKGRMAEGNFYFFCKLLPIHLFIGFFVYDDTIMQILTKDSVTVFVNAIMYYKVIDILCILVTDTKTPF